MDGVTVEAERCRWCGTTIVFNPFVAQWQTMPTQSVCPRSPGEWKTHEIPVLYSPNRILGVIGDLVDIVSAGSANSDGLQSRSSS